MKIGDIASMDIDHLDSEKLEKTLHSEVTIMANPEESAVEVAARFTEEAGGLVVVVDAARKPTGIVDPTSFRTQVEHYKGITSKSFKDAVEQYSASPEEQKEGFQHEWLNGLRVNPHYCKPGEHLTTSDPCPIHEV